MKEDNNILVKKYDADLKITMLCILKWMYAVPRPSFFADVEGVVSNHKCVLNKLHMFELGKYVKNLRVLYGYIPWSREMAWVGETVERVAIVVVRAFLDDMPKIQWKRLKLFIARLHEPENQFDAIIETVYDMPRLDTFCLCIPDDYSKYHTSLLQAVHRLRPKHHIFYLEEKNGIKDMDELVGYIEDFSKHADVVSVVPDDPRFRIDAIAQAASQRGVSLLGVFEGLKQAINAPPSHDS